jgi:phosphatidylglycerophosphatase A
MKFNKELFDEILVTGIFVGKIKKAPGTFGSLLALAVLLLENHIIWYFSLIIVLFLCIISIKPIQRYEKKYGNDNSSIVIDEVIGMLLTFSNPYIIISPFWLALTFGIFRLFDILKPYPINKINDNTGAVFVIADDILAGIFTLLSIQILQLGYRILPFFLSFFEII